jgi:REP element-mobilizing transposase RayT
LGPFGCLTELGAKWAELVQKFVPRSSVGNFRNEHTRSTPLDPKHTFWCVSYYLGAFGSVWLPYETRGKAVVQKFVPRSHVRIFQNERTRSTPLDPKLTFWCVSYYFGAFGTVWLPYETQCKAGRTSAKVRATKSRRNFSQRTHRIHPIGR